MRAWWLMVILFFWIPSGQSEPLLTNGDEVFIYLPGEKAFMAPFTIEDNGKVLLPEVGAIAIAGLTEKQAEALIKRRLSLVFRNLNQYSLTLKGHEIRIRILGLVSKPGLVSLKSNSDLQMAITAAEGILPGAQLNKIQIRKKNKQVFTINYKNYLNTGDTTNIPKLETGDTIFIPASPLMSNIQGNKEGIMPDLDNQDPKKKIDIITVFGELRSPGTFPFDEKLTVIDALMAAGGVTRYADVAKIRIVTQRRPYEFDLKKYLDSGMTIPLPPLQPDSTIFVPVAVKDIGVSTNNIYIMGEVKTPGAYENNKEVNFVDVLANAGGPTRFADTTQIRILKKNQPSELLNLVEYTKNPENFKIPQLNSGDVIFIPEKNDQDSGSWLKVTQDRAIRILGAVISPGRYEWDNKFGLLDLLSHAGGPTDRANISQIKIIKGSQPNKKNNIQLFDLESFLKEGGDFTSLPNLAAGDTVIIDELPRDPSSNKASWIRQSKEDSIYIFGLVGSPGRYAFNRKLGFLDILSAAGGPTPDANLKQIRISHRNGVTTKVTRLNLSLYFETGDESLIPKIVPGDVIYIPAQNNNWEDKPADQIVRLMGSVNRPGRYDFSYKMSVLDLLAEAGGPTTTGDISRVMIVNVSCCGDKGQIFNLDKYIKYPQEHPLPLLRAGDTVYVPDKSDSTESKWRKGLTDAASIISLILLGATVNL